MFWKVVPSGEGAGGQRRSPANATTVESRESTRGSHAHLPCAAVAALMVSFAEPSCSAATAIIRTWLCPSHTCALPCLASLGPGGHACQSWIYDGFLKCALSGPGFQCGGGHRLSGLTQPVFPQMVCVYPHEAGPRGTACTSLQDLINPVAWEASLSPPHTPHPPGGPGSSLSSFTTEDNAVFLCVRYIRTTSQGRACGKHS